MYRGQQIAQMLIEKQQMDDILMNKDHTVWYKVNRLVFQGKFSLFLAFFSCRHLDLMYIQMNNQKATVVMKSVN